MAGQRTHLWRGGVGLLAALLAAGTLHAQGILGSIPLAGGAQGIEVNAITNRFYVAVGTLNYLVAIDAATNSTIGTVPVGAGPSAVAVNPATNRVYVASSIGNSVTVVDGATHTVLGTITGLAGPTGLDVNPATNRLYVANNAAGTLAVIDGATNAVLGTIAVGAGPRDVAVNPATNRIYVSNAGSGAAPGNTVSVVDGASGTVAATVQVGTRPGVLAVNPTTGRVYVVNQGSNNVSVLDGATNAVVATISVGTSPLGLAVNPATNHILVVNAGSNDASLIDGSTNVVIATLPLSGGAGEVAAHPQLGRFVVASQGVPFGLTVLQDPANLPGASPLAAAPASLAAVLRPLGPLPISGTVTFTSGPAGQTQVSATLQGVPAGSAAALSVPLPTGAVTVPCTSATSGPATCAQAVSGAPSVGANVVATVGGQPVAQGAVVGGSLSPAGPALPGGAIPLQAVAGVLLAPAPGATVNGVCNLVTSAAASTGGLTADCLLQGVPAGQVVALNLAGGPGAVALSCPPAPVAGTVTCSQALAAAPVSGAQVTASVGGQPVAQGTVAVGPQPLPPPVRATAGALLQPVGGATPAGGVVNFSPGPNTGQTVVSAALDGIPAGQQATVQVPVVSGPPAPLVCPPAAATGQAVCSQVLNGAPLQGASVTVSVNGQVVAQGAVAPGPQPPGAPGGSLASGAIPPAPGVVPVALAGAPPPPPNGLLVAPPPGGAPGALAGVPVVPEAHSLALVALGLALLAGAAAGCRGRAGRERR